MKKIFTIITILFSIMPLFSQVMTEVQYFEKDPTIGIGMGGSISITENFAMVGSANDTINGVSCGSVYVFEKSGNQWNEYDTLFSETQSQYEGFGFTVEMNDEWALISSLNYIPGYGTVNVFKNISGTWTYETQLKADIEDSLGVNYGFSIDISDTNAIVGAPGMKIDDFDNAGAAYIYSNKSGSWEEMQKITASNPDYSNCFGHSVSIMGKFALIGAFGNNSNGQYSGAVYVFEYKDTSWVETQILTPSDASDFDRFGYSVDHYENYSIIGACTKDGDNLEMGAAYIFELKDTIWLENKKLSTPPGLDTLGRFGLKVKINDQFAVVGAPGGIDISSMMLDGAAYLYKLETGNWNYLLSLDYSQGNITNMGASIGMSGDYIFLGSRRQHFVNYMYSYSFYIFNIQAPWYTTQYEPEIPLCPNTELNLALDGAGTYTYQWQLSNSIGNFADISDIYPYSGSDSSTLTISDISSDMNDYRYRCIISNPIATTYSYNYRINVGPENPVVVCRYDLSIEPTTGYDYYIATDNLNSPFNTNHCGEGTLYNNITGTEIIKGVELPVGDTVITWTIVDGKGDSASCSQSITILANDIFENNGDLYVFPNPCKDILNINFPNIEQGIIQVYDLDGKLLKSQAIEGHYNKLYIRDLNSGLYIVRVEANSQLYIAKFSKY